MAASGSGVSVRPVIRITADVNESDEVAYAVVCAALYDGNGRMLGFRFCKRWLPITNGEHVYEVYDYNMENDAEEPLVFADAVRSRVKSMKVFLLDGSDRPLSGVLDRTL